MPKYVYFCEVCEALFEVFHGMKEKHSVCNLCGKEDFIYRVPQKTSIFQKDNVGQKTRENIEENRKILKEMIKKTRSEEHE